MLPMRKQAGEFAWIGSDEEEGRAHFLNQVTASARALAAGQGEYPKSRAAFSWETHIFFFAMRTASKGTRGGTPVKSAHAVLKKPAANATA